MNISEYPKQLTVNVLLLDDKIINWRVGSSVWENIVDCLSYPQPDVVFDYIYSDRLKIRNKTEIVNDIKENNYFYEVTAKNFLKKWDIHEDYPITFFKPY